MSKKEKNGNQAQADPSAAQTETTVEAQDVTPKKKNGTLKIVLTVIEIVCLVAMVISGAFVAKFFIEEYKEEEESDENSEDFNDDSEEYNREVVIDPKKSDGKKDTTSSDGDDPTSSDAEEPTESDGDDPTNPDSEEPEDEEEEEEEEDAPFVLKYLTGKSLAKANAKSEPKQIVAWMEMTGWTNATLPARIKSISQPVAQGTDNAYYLSHDAYGAEKDYGAVYVDCRCDMSDLLNNKNIVIYAHAKSSSRFGILKSLNKCSEWINTEKYHYVYLQTETETTIWKIFSWYTTDKDSPYRNTKFTTDEAFVEYCNSLQKKNKLKGLDTYEFTADDVIMTMSTCKGIESDTRVAVHAVLVAHAYLEDLKK